jgi:hypothetical protein
MADITLPLTFKALEQTANAAAGLARAELMAVVQMVAAAPRLEFPNHQHCFCLVED